MPRKTPDQLRSHRWFGESDMRGFGHHSRVAQMGYSRADYQGKPVIAIVNTWSDINQCHAHFRQRADEVRRGVLQAGGFPLELPAISLSEPIVKPTTMLYRNFLAMETEELLRSHPVDGAVLMGGMVMVGGIVLNKSPVDLTMVTPIARLTSEYLGVVVPAGSPHKSMADLVAAFKADPGKVSWHGGSAGGSDHILAGLIAKAVGVDPAKGFVIRRPIPPGGMQFIAGFSLKVRQAVRDLLRTTLASATAMTRPAP